MPTFDRRKLTLSLWPIFVLLVAACSIVIAYRGLYPPRLSPVSVSACIALTVTLLTFLLRKRFILAASLLTAIVGLFCLLLLCAG